VPPHDGADGALETGAAGVARVFVAAVGIDIAGVVAHVPIAPDTRAAATRPAVGRRQGSQAGSLVSALAARRAPGRRAARRVHHTRLRRRLRQGVRLVPISAQLELALLCPPYNQF